MLNEQLELHSMDVTRVGSANVPNKIPWFGSLSRSRFHHHHLHRGTHVQLSMAHRVFSAHCAGHKGQLFRRHPSCPAWSGMSHIFRSVSVTRLALLGPRVDRPQITVQWSTQVYTFQARYENTRLLLHIDELKLNNNTARRLYLY